MSNSETNPQSILCPQCAGVVEYVQAGKNYPCERCGVLWRWTKNHRKEKPDMKT